MAKLLLRLATAALFAPLAAAVVPAAVDSSAIQLASLNIDKARIVTVGHGNGADFAHQMHIAFSATVSGACIFSGQPFNCATSGFPQDTPEWHALKHHSSANDHCKNNPNVVDVGSLVDYPRRHCGQNPISTQECFDDVNYVKHSRAFVFRGTHDNISMPGAAENVVALLAQMMTDPARNIKLVTDQPFAHTLPLTSTPHAGSTIPAGYDGPGECLRHVFDSPWMRSTHQALPANWLVFDQREFFEDQIGLQDFGWVYVPARCRSLNHAGPGSNPCRLIVRPGRCEPPRVGTMDPDLTAWAAYGEAEGIVVLHPCLGGALNTTKYPYAPDVTRGFLDVYGQLDPNYVQQSAPHMRAIGKMMRRVLPEDISPSEPPIVRAHIAQLSSNREPSDALSSAPSGAPSDAPASRPSTHLAPNSASISRMPTLNIERSSGSIITAGCSNTADFATQFHVAFSSLVTGACVFSGMPFHCAVTRFPRDYMVAKSPSTAAGVHCPDCPSNGTLIYDHCKNHPEWVDIDMLAAYAEHPPPGHVIDDPKIHLADARVFSFGPTHDRCYQPPAMQNVANFYRRYAANASEQVLLVEDQPFPHTLPTNGTAYYNNESNHTGAGYDGPGKCLQHVFGHGKRLWASEQNVTSYWRRINTSEFVSEANRGGGMKDSAWLFVPAQCVQGLCKLIILPGGCDAFTDRHPPNGGSDDAFARYGAVNGIVVLKPCQCGPIDQNTYPHNHENLRGMVDVYGQTTPEYATQKGMQMEPMGKMLKRLLGVA